MIFIMILAILHNLTHFWYPIVAVVTKIIESTSSQIITKMEDDGDHDDDDEADDDEEEKDYDEETDGEEEKDDDEDSVDHRKLSDRKWSGSMEGTWHPPSPARDDHDDEEDDHVDDDDDNDDDNVGRHVAPTKSSLWYIYYDEVSVCLSVTKNDHFLLGVSCNHLNPH